MNRHSALAILGQTAIIALLAILLRFLAIEPQSIGLTCAQEVPPGWCLPRQALVDGFQLMIFGWCAVPAAVAAHLLPVHGRGLARLGLAAGVMGMVFYNGLGGAAGFVIALLALAREAEKTA